MLFLLHEFCLSAMRDAASSWVLADVGWWRAIRPVPRWRGRRTQALVAMTLALAVVAAACGGDDDAATGPVAAAPAADGATSEPSDAATPDAAAEGAETTASEPGADEPEANAPTAGGFPIEVVDDSGETITIARAPTRVVALLPSVTDLIIDLGLSDRIIATDEFSLASPELAQLPSVGGSGNTFNLEATVELQPELIVTASGGTEPFITQLRTVGLTVVVFDFPANIAEMLDHLGRLGTIFGIEDESTALVADLKARLDTVAATVADRAPVRVYLEIDQSTPTQPFTVSEGSLHHEVMTLAGGANVFADTAGAFPQVNWEAIIAGNPEVILLLDSTDFAADFALNPVSIEDVAARTGWSEIDAVLRDAIVPLPPDLFNGGVEIVAALERVAAVLDEHRPK